ncbi:MAG: hypothetical protein WD051_05560 [Steroidobacteraceae bacterium]
MASMKTNEQICAAVEGAFSPLNCVAEIWDYEQKLRFRVSDATNETVLTCPNEVLANLRDDTALTAFLQNVRAEVEDNGYTLNPWLGLG